MISLPSHPRTTAFLAVKHTETVLSLCLLLSFTFFFLCTLYIVTFCCSLKECPAAVHSFTLQTKLAASEAYAPKQITHVGLSMIISSLVRDYLCWFCFGVAGLWAEQWAECSENCSKHIDQSTFISQTPVFISPQETFLKRETISIHLEMSHLSSHDYPFVFLWSVLLSFTQLPLHECIIKLLLSS